MGIFKEELLTFLRSEHFLAYVGVKIEYEPCTLQTILSVSINKG